MRPKTSPDPFSPAGEPQLPRLVRFQGQLQALSQRLAAHLLETHQLAVELDKRREDQDWPRGGGPCVEPVTDGLISMLNRAKCGFCKLFGLDNMHGADFGEICVRKDFRVRGPNNSEITHAEGK